MHQYDEVNQAIAHLYSFNWPDFFSMTCYGYRSMYTFLDVLDLPVLLVSERSI